MTEVEAYIRAGAIARGIDPDVAVRIAMTEGGVTDPYQMSKVPLKEGGTEQSVGPFQLLLNGGLGAEAMKIGVDPTKNWKAGIDFALDTAAKKKSWADWHGARDNGISNSAGFGDATKPIGVTLTSLRHVGGAGSGEANYADPNVVQVPDAPDVVETEPEKELTWQDKLKKFVEGDKDAEGNTKESAGMAGLDAIAKGLSHRTDPAVAAAQMEITPSSIGMTDPSLVANASAMMSQLLDSRRKRYGLSLMG
jgi:hypothetical protein